MYSFPPKAVWTCRVYPFPQPAVWTSRVHPFFKCWIGLSGIQSIRYQNEQKCGYLNQSGTGIRGPSPVPECCGTGLRYRTECRCRRHRPRCRCPSLHFSNREITRLFRKKCCKLLHSWKTGDWEHRHLGDRRLRCGSF